MYLSLLGKRQMSFLERPNPYPEYCFHYHIPLLGDRVIETERYYFFQGNEHTRQYIETLLSYYNYNTASLPTLNIKDNLMSKINLPNLREEVLFFLDEETQYYGFALTKQFFILRSTKPKSHTSRIYQAENFQDAVFVPPITL